MTCKFHLDYTADECIAFIASDKVVFAIHLCQYDITWQTNAFNASGEIVSATHL